MYCSEEEESEMRARGAVVLVLTAVLTGCAAKTARTPTPETARLRGGPYWTELRPG